MAKCSCIDLLLHRFSNNTKVIPNAMFKNNRLIVTWIIVFNQFFSLLHTRKDNQQNTAIVYVSLLRINLKR